jgi:hypothetical protein
MKKLVTIIALALAPALAFSQAAFEKFETSADITSCIISQKTFSMLGSVKTASNADAEKFQKLAKQIESVRIHAAEKPEAAAEIKSAGEAYIASAKMEELIRVKDKDVSLKVMVKSKSETRISELLLLVEPAKTKADAVLILVKGDFDLDEIAELADSAALENKTGGKLNPAKEAFDLMVSPNPVTDTFFINTDKPAAVKVYDLSGRLVKSTTYEKSGVSVSGLQPATYVVEIDLGDKRQTQQIVVK